MVPTSPTCSLWYACIDHFNGCLLLHLPLFHLLTIPNLHFCTLLLSISANYEQLGRLERILRLLIGMNFFQRTGIDSHHSGTLGVSAQPAPSTLSYPLGL